MRAIIQSTKYQTSLNMFKLCLIALFVVLAVAQISAAPGPYDGLKQNQANYLKIVRDTIAQFRTNIAENWLGEDSPQAAQYLTPLTDDVYVQFLKDLLNAQTA